LILATLPPAQFVKRINVDNINNVFMRNI